MCNDGDGMCIIWRLGTSLHTDLLPRKVRIRCNQAQIYLLGFHCFCNCFALPAASLRSCIAQEDKLMCSNRSRSTGLNVLITPLISATILSGRLTMLYAWCL